MDAIFSNLTAAENSKLVDAIPLITLLIGSADGIFEEQEKAWAERVIKFRMFSHNQELQHYYEAISVTFEDRLNNLMRHTAESAAFRKAHIVEKLKELNPIIKKLGGHEAYRLYSDFLSFAKHVAKSSGGILYMANISPAEKELINLDMITPINTYPGI